jgi:uncharacterized lipoprotein YbaY
MSRAILSLVALALMVTASPVVAADDDTDTPMIVSGLIQLPASAALPDGAIVDVEVQDTALADARAVTISRLSMPASGVTSPIPFALSVLPGALDEMGDYTLRVRVEAADGALLFINDTFTPAIDASGPITDVAVELVAVPA